MSQTDYSSYAEDWNGPCKRTGGSGVGHVTVQRGCVEDVVVLCPVIVYDYSEYMLSWVGNFSRPPFGHFDQGDFRMCNGRNVCFVFCGRLSSNGC